MIHIHTHIDSKRILGFRLSGEESFFNDNRFSKEKLGHLFETLK